MKLPKWVTEGTLTQRKWDELLKFAERRRRYDEKMTGELSPIRTERIVQVAGWHMLCGHCGRLLSKEGYVYAHEGGTRWFHRECVHKYLESKEGKAFLSERRAITIADEEKACDKS